MCNFSGKLIAWLDLELQESDAAEVERHVATCAECRGKIAAYEKIGSAIACYCDEVVARDRCRKAQPWAPIVAAVAAIAMVAIVLSFPRTRAQVHRETPPAGHPQTLVSLPVSAAPVVLEAPLEPVKRIHQRHIRKVAPHEQARWSADFSSEGAPSVEIAIPAGALFPPGVFPEGVSFVADLSVAADGSARTLRLQPY